MEIKQEFRKDLRVVIERVDSTQWLSSACNNYLAIKAEIEEENLEVNFNIQPEHTDTDETKDLVIRDTPCEENESTGVDHKDESVDISKRAWCHKCDIDLKNMKRFDLHNAKVHNIVAFWIERKNKNYKGMDYECKECDVSFQFKKDYIVHLHKKHGIVPVHRVKRFACKLCSFKTAVEVNYKNHMECHKKNWTRDFRCLHCADTFRIPVMFLSHLKTHSDCEKFVCVFCNKKYTSKLSIDNHLLIHHGDQDIDGFISNQIFKCDQCPYKAAKADYLEYHLQMKHKAIKKKFYCYNCDFSTDHKSSLKSHMMRHMRSVKCRYCNKVASTIHLLNRHMANKHFNKADVQENITIKLHKCHVCPHITTDINIYERHLLSKHDIKPNRELLSCKHCSYTTYFRASMLYHSRLHTGKRHECKRCGKRVQQKIGLDAHIYNCHRDDEEMVKTITNKIFTCKYCSKYSVVGTNPIKNHMKSCKRKMKSLKKH